MFGFRTLNISESLSIVYSFPTVGSLEVNKWINGHCIIPFAIYNGKVDGEFMWYSSRLTQSLVIMIVWILFGCRSSNPQIDVQPPSEPSSINSESDAEMLIVTADSVAELTEYASLIIIGTAKNTDYAFNSARDVNDISKPDLSLLALGQLYEVTVERVIKGQFDRNTLLLVQGEGILIKQQTDIVPSPEDEAIARQQVEYIPLSDGRRYLFFLNPMPEFHELGYYSGVREPWRFDISNPEQIRAESLAAIPGISTLDRLLADIAAVATPTPTAEATSVSPLPTPHDGVITPVPEVTKAP